MIHAEAEAEAEAEGACLWRKFKIGDDSASVLTLIRQLRRVNVGTFLETETVVFGFFFSISTVKS